jgi:hypothetical protein
VALRSRGNSRGVMGSHCQVRSLAIRSRPILDHMTSRQKNPLGMGSGTFIFSAGTSFTFFHRLQGYCTLSSLSRTATSSLTMAIPNGNAIHACTISTRPLILSCGKIRVSWPHTCPTTSTDWFSSLFSSSFQSRFLPNPTNGLLLKSFATSLPTFNLN